MTLSVVRAARTARCVTDAWGLRRASDIANLAARTSGEMFLSPPHSMHDRGGGSNRERGCGAARKK